MKVLLHRRQESAGVITICTEEPSSNALNLSNADPGANAFLTAQWNYICTELACVLQILEHSSERKYFTVVTDSPFEFSRPASYIICTVHVLNQAALHDHGCPSSSQKTNKKLHIIISTTGWSKATPPIQWGRNIDESPFIP